MASIAPSVSGREKTQRPQSKRADSGHVLCQQFSVRRQLSSVIEENARHRSRMRNLHAERAIFVRKCADRAKLPQWQKALIQSSAFRGDSGEGR